MDYQANENIQVNPENQTNQPLEANLPIIVDGKEINNYNDWCKFFILIYILPFFVIAGIIFGIFFLENIYYHIPGILVIVSIVFVLCGIFLMKSLYYKIGYYIYLGYIILSSIRAVYFFVGFVILSVFVQIFASIFDKSEDKQNTKEEFGWLRLQMFLYLAITCIIEYILFCSLLRRLKAFDELDKLKLKQVGQISPA